MSEGRGSTSRRATSSARWRQLPKQGAQAAVATHQNYAKDLLSLRYGSLRDKAMVFSR